MQDVMIAERVEVTTALEASGEPADMVPALDDGDLVCPRPRERVGCGRTGKASAENDNPPRRHGPGSSSESSSMWNTAGRKSGVMAIWCTVSQIQTVIVVALSWIVSQVPRFQFAWSPVGEYL